MEPVTHLSNTIQGVEVLFFKDAEVTKVKGDQKSFATFGVLSVLYFKDYHRFVLQLNDWRYPLLRRLTVSSNGTGSYMLPAMNGFSYNLKINAGSGQALANFDNLLLGIKGLEKSPEDNLMRRQGHQLEIGTRKVINETINEIFNKVNYKASTFKTETKYLTSKKKRVDLKVIKNKDFKKEAQSKIKKTYLESREKVTNQFTTRRQNNFNQIEPRDIETLRKTTGYDAAVMYLPKEDIEEIILRGKDIFYATAGPMEPHHETKKGFMESLKEGLHHMKDNLRGETRAAGHAGHTGAVTEKNTVSVEGLTHYQG